jgi:hypothetical protein
MTIRVKRKMWVNTSLNTDMTDLAYGPTEPTRLRQTDAHDQWDGAHFSLAIAGNVTLDLSGVDNIRGIYLQADQDITVTINGSDTPILLKKDDATTANLVCEMMMMGVITSVYILAGASATTGHFHIWGLAT